jgi:hypothetical protein
MKRVILFGVVAAVALLTSGCTLTADKEQKKTVRETFAALPDPVNRALRVEKVRLHYFNPTGEDVGADRKIHLDVGSPQDTTLGGWVAGCRAMVVALAPTPARLYGRLPDGADVYEATDALCLRGQGYPVGDSEVKPSLMLGLPEGERILDTAVNFDPDAGTIETFGYDWRPRGGVIEVAEAVPADLDKAVRAVPVPWRLSDPDKGRAMFLVPAGTVLQLTASCGAGQTGPGYFQYHSSADETQLTFASRDPAPIRPEGREGIQACGATLQQALRPQVSYRAADGRQMDRYVFSASIGYLEPGEAAPSIEVTRR